MLRFRQKQVIKKHMLKYNMIDYWPTSRVIGILEIKLHPGQQREQKFKYFLFKIN